jgi:hypothetical protein
MSCYLRGRLLNTRHKLSEFAHRPPHPSYSGREHGQPRLHRSYLSIIPGEPIQSLKYRLDVLSPRSSLLTSAFMLHSQVI